MLLWLVVAAGFVVCVLACHFCQRVTWGAAAILFVASAALFSVQLKFIYDKTTTDHHLVTGHITSLVHHRAYSYFCAKLLCEEPETWIIEQRPRPPRREGFYVRPIHRNDGVEDCQGECFFSYPMPPYEDYKPKDASDVAATATIVSHDKFNKTSLGDTSAVWKPYFNPIKASDEVVYGNDNTIPEFEIDDYNIAHRLIAPKKTAYQEKKLEDINIEFSPRNISVGLIVTPDNLYFEKLKRSWHQGKDNDFVVVVSTSDGASIHNVNVLGWGNDDLKENVAGAIMALPSADIDAILATIDKTLQQGEAFVPVEFSQYKFLDTKIPKQYYAWTFLFQTSFFIYILTLLYFNPNSKNKKLSWSNVRKMWGMRFSPPQANWYLHPLTPSGLFLYVVVPWLAWEVMKP